MPGHKASSPPLPGIVLLIKVPFLFFTSVLESDLLGFLDSRLCSKAPASLHVRPPQPHSTARARESLKDDPQTQRSHLVRPTQRSRRTVQSSVMSLVGWGDPGSGAEAF